jgi:hypothetical protein
MKGPRQISPKTREALLSINCRFVRMKKLAEIDAKIGAGKLDLKEKNENDHRKR